jgi:hypothetical protein
MKPVPDSNSTQTAPPRVEPTGLSRASVIDAVARVVARRGPAGMRWSTLAREAGHLNVSRAWLWFEDMQALVGECYSRTAQGLDESLLRAETAPGTALDKLAAFLVAALETRRERGSFLPFSPSDDMPAVQRKRLRERDLMVRTRLKRLLMQGQRDGSLALRHTDSACALILACLQVPVVTDDGPEQRMWDAELVELLLAALAEPHATDKVARREVTAVMQGACACGTVRYEVDGPLDLMSHCHCAMCREHHGSAFVTFVSAPLTGFRWIAGESAVTTYRSSTKQRSFCSVCGSVTPVLEPESGVVFCPAGNLDAELGAPPEGHVFVGSKVSWLSSEAE